MLRSRVCPPHRRRHRPSARPRPPIPLFFSPARLLFSLAEVLEEEAGEGDFFQRRGSLTDGAESSTHPQRERERESSPILHPLTARGDLDRTPFFAR